MYYLLYYGLLKPLSLLPSRVLYVLSDFVFVVIYYGGLYRKKIVTSQMTSSFPEKSAKEIEGLVKKFFAHFCDLMVESLKIFSISRANAIKKCRLVNSELFEELYAKNRNIIIAGGHYNNWEMLAVAIDAQIPHQAVALYTPLANKNFDTMMMESRSKYGLRLYPKKKSLLIFKGKHDKPYAAIFGADQCPTTSKNVYWTTFLNQETAVAFGTEKYAVEHDCAVVFGRISKIKRGYYEMSFELITDNPKAEPFGSITSKHTALLEADIKKQPEFWLWTHRRWKKKRRHDEPVLAHKSS